VIASLDCVPQPRRAKVKARAAADAPFAAAAAKSTQNDGREDEWPVLVVRVHDLVAPASGMKTFVTAIAAHGALDGRVTWLDRASLHALPMMPAALYTRMVGE